MKTIALIPALLLVGFSSVALSIAPPAAPAKYDNGPAVPYYDVTDLSDAERAAYALYEAILKIAQAKINATSCGSSVGEYEVEVFTNGLVESDPDRLNFATVTSMAGEFRLDARMKEKVAYRGQKVFVAQVGAGELDGNAVGTYTGVSTYNEFNNMVLVDGSANIKGITGHFSNYRSSMIKNYFHGDGAEAYFVFGWGNESLHKLGYPVSKYWDRSKSGPSNGEIGRTLFVKDRLVGPTSCRIIVDTDGYNNEDFFWQNGFLVISMTDPIVPVPEFDEF